MNQFPVDEFNCSVGCENANQCEYYNNLPPNQVIPQLQNYVENGNFYYGNDGVVPSSIYQSNNQQMQTYPSYPNQGMVQPVAQPQNVFYNQSVDQGAGYSGGAYFTDTMQTYPPCHGPQPWNFAQCYGYYGEAPCQFSNVVDMEDFMNNEKRKEKSRDAARCRRSKETEIFTDLASSLPMKSEEIDHLDKASVMRLSISYLKVRKMIGLFPKSSDEEASVDETTMTEEEETKDVKSQVLSKYVEDEKLALMALEGFLLVLNDDGDITFVSENICDILGLSKLDMMGQAIWDYAHACDHDELRETLNGRKTSPSELLSGAKSTDFNPMMHRDMMLRLKCTLTKSGRFVNIKSAAYKVIHLTGHIVFKDDGYRQLVAIGRPLAHPSNIEAPLGSSTFLSKHTLDMKFSYVDSPKMFELLGYKPEHLLGKSLYDYHHGNDSDSLMTSFKCLISKGQTETNRYRFLARNGGWAWIVTQATVVYDKQKPQSVVCVNYVISGIENEHEILSCAQLEAQQELSKVVEQGAAKSATEQTEPKVVKRDNIVLGISDLKQKRVDAKSTIGQSKSVAKPVVVVDATSNKKEIGNIIGEQITINPINTIKVNTCEIVSGRPRSVTAGLFSPLLQKAETQQQKTPTVLSTTTKAFKTRAQSSTAKIFRPNPQNVTSVTSRIFAPRTKDMNKGFLMFSEDDSGLTMLKDEPDDLTHLAPTAGDACIPLDETAPFFSDMFDDFIIPDNYNAMLTDELNSLDSTCSKTTSSSSSNDPFINYRDDSNDICHSPHLLSPGLSKSPDANSLPSLCSPGSLPEDELAFMTLNMEDDLDMSMRAPYISMSESSELPMLIAEDLMWGAQPDLKQTLHVNKKMELNVNNQSEENIEKMKANATYQQQQKSSMESSLASLLCSQLMQHHQQQQQQQLQEQQMSQAEQQIILNQYPDMKFQVMQQGGNVTLVNSNELQMKNQETRMAPETIEWTMDDLLQLKRQPSTTKINHEESDDQNASASHINQTEHKHQQQPNAEAIVKCKEKSNVNHKRPSLAHDISSSKRAKGQDSIKATPQLLQQLMTSSGCNQKKKIVETSTSNGVKWSPVGSPQKVQQHASNSVLMNLLVSGCDEPLSIDPPDDPMEVSEESMASPIVINDKMLSQSAVGAPANLCSLLTPNDLQIYRAIQQGVSERKIGNDPYTSFIDSEDISAILMDLNEQDYEVNIPVNELLKMM